MKTRCYIAGKIGNLPEAEWRANFEQARQLVADMGFEPVCPTCLPHRHDKSWQSHMREDLIALLSCDVLYAQRNWKSSKGARIEVQLAHSLDISIIDQCAIDRAEEVSATPEKARAYLVEQGYDVDAFVEQGLAKIRQLQATTPRAGASSGER